MSEGNPHSAAIEITEDYPTYTAVQTGEQTDADTLSPPKADGHKFELNWSHGPVTYEGYIDPYDLDLKVLPTVSGIKIGVFDGTLKDGIAVKVDLKSTKGNSNIYLKNGNEVWANLDLYTVSDRTHHTGDYKLVVF